MPFLWYFGWPLWWVVFVMFAWRGFRFRVVLISLRVGNGYFSSGITLISLRVGNAALDGSCWGVLLTLMCRFRRLRMSLHGFIDLRWILAEIIFWPHIFTQVSHVITFNHALYLADTILAARFHHLLSAVLRHVYLVKPF